MWTDTARLFDYGFTRYHTMSFSQMFDRAPIYAIIRNAATEDEGAGQCCRWCGQRWTFKTLFSRAAGKWRNSPGLRIGTVPLPSWRGHPGTITRT